MLRVSLIFSYFLSLIVLRTLCELCCFITRFTYVHSFYLHFDMCVHLTNCRYFAYFIMYYYIYFNLHLIRLYLCFLLFIEFHFGSLQTQQFWPLTLEIRHFYWTNLDKDVASLDISEMQTYIWFYLCSNWFRSESNSFRNSVNRIQISMALLTSNTIARLPFSVCHFPISLFIFILLCRSATFDLRK